MGPDEEGRCRREWKVATAGTPEKLEVTLNALARTGWEIQTVTDHSEGYTVTAWRVVPATGVSLPD